ncbi:BLUF domain-containing protein [Alteromonas sp. a30]|uniref:BLUF domain-containing protein n=1 Tax=Alteromonas sp. a30 TaxID=2730917 RepID=UPI00227FB28F|nr:BLUF domain-containing protein [Alteromonas sp. a30]MCY7294498.1 BLUF domain-containing protein [Alteromonas sp. a30]
MNLFQLTYMSQSELHPLGLHEELEIIQKAASELNREKQISGILVYRNGFFLQRIEGNRKAVIYLAESIAKDRRHKHFKILEQGPIQRRMFDDWSELQLLSTKKETAALAPLFNVIEKQSQTSDFLRINATEALACMKSQWSHVA